MWSFRLFFKSGTTCSLISFSNYFGYLLVSLRFLAKPPLKYHKIIFYVYFRGQCSDRISFLKSRKFFLYSFFIISLIGCLISIRSKSALYAYNFLDAMLFYALSFSLLFAFTTIEPLHIHWQEKMTIWSHTCRLLSSSSGIGGLLRPKNTGTAYFPHFTHLERNCLNRKLRVCTHAIFRSKHVFLLLICRVWSRHFQIIKKETG